jgi:1-acyl-sn-glycerol-3-phosphate acyltransferase
MKRKTFIYSEDKTQDFANIQIDSEKPLPNDFKFIKTNLIVRFLSWCFYYLLAVPILWLFSKIIYRTKIVNKKTIKKELKNTGYFIYSNHTLLADAWNHQVFTTFPRKAYIVSQTDTITKNKVLGEIVIALGAIPLPSNIKTARNFLKALKTRLNQNRVIVICPEGTIWPYYTKQRPVREGSFKYPRTFNKPVVFACTTFRKPKGPFKNHRIPKVVIYLSNPIYPNRSSVEKIDEKRLQQLYTSFIEKCSSIDENYAYYDYISTTEYKKKVEFMEDHYDEVEDSYLNDKTVELKIKEDN